MQIFQRGNNYLPSFPISLINKATNLLHRLVDCGILEEGEEDDLNFSQDEISTMVSILAKFIIAKGFGAENITPPVKQICLASLACLTLRDTLSVECLLRCDGLVKEVVHFANFSSAVGTSDASFSAVNTLQFICDVATDEDLLRFFELAPLFLLTVGPLLDSEGSVALICTMCKVMSTICRRTSPAVLAKVVAVDSLIPEVVRVSRNPELCVDVRFAAIECIFHVFRGATSELALHVIVHMDGLAAVMDLLQSNEIHLTSARLLEALKVMQDLFKDKINTVADWNVVLKQMDTRNFWKTLGKLKVHRNKEVCSSASRFVKKDLKVDVVQGEEGNEV